MKNLILAMLFASVSSHAFAQTFSIKGLVKNQTNEVVPFATVEVHRTADSSLAKAELADDKGNFKISGIAKNDYFIKITAVGG